MGTKRKYRTQRVAVGRFRGPTCALGRQRPRPARNGDLLFSRHPSLPYLPAGRGLYRPWGRDVEASAPLFLEIKTSETRLVSMSVNAAWGAGFTLAKFDAEHAEPRHVAWCSCGVTRGSAPQTMQGRPPHACTAVGSRTGSRQARAEELGPPPRQAIWLRHGAPRHAIGGAWHLHRTSTSADGMALPTGSRNEHTNRARPCIDSALTRPRHPTWWSNNMFSIGSTAS